MCDIIGAIKETSTTNCQGNDTGASSIRLTSPMPLRPISVREAVEAKPNTAGRTSDRYVPLVLQMLRARDSKFG